MMDRHTSHLHNDYVDGLLSEKQASEVDNHADSCEKCREDLNQLRNLKDRLAAIDAPDPGLEYFERLSEKVAERTHSITNESNSKSVNIKPVSASQAVLKTLIRVAAAITLLFGSFYASDFLSGNNQSPNSDNWAVLEYNIPDPIALPDSEHQQPPPSAVDEESIDKEDSDTEN
ncbi:MAG: zf-HC2 domain-containing protein [candidate division Zixibacteria bacterium]|nr:zf-HC2 domain-containing protein [candidate division Zixibacteria bacterium]